MTKRKTKDTKPAEKRKARVYSGVVITPFKTGGKEYELGDVYKTEHKPSLDYLINSKRLK